MFYLIPLCHFPLNHIPLSCFNWFCYTRFCNTRLIFYKLCPGSCHNLISWSHLVNWLPHYCMRPLAAAREGSGRNLQSRMSMQQHVSQDGQIHCQNLHSRIQMRQELSQRGGKLAFSDSLWDRCCCKHSWTWWDSSCCIWIRVCKFSPCDSICLKWNLRLQVFHLFATASVASLQLSNDLVTAPVSNESEHASFPHS